MQPCCSRFLASSASGELREDEAGAMKAPPSTVILHFQARPGCRRGSGIGRSQDRGPALAAAEQTQDHDMIGGGCGFSLIGHACRAVHHRPALGEAVGGQQAMLTGKPRLKQENMTYRRRVLTGSESREATFGPF